MFVSVCRTLEYDLPALRSMPRDPRCHAVAVGGRRGTARCCPSSRRHDPDGCRRGRGAAEQAATSHPDDALAVVGGTARAHDALARTPEQLDVLASAGVVDAGGQAYVLLIDVLAEVLGGAPAQPLTTGVPRLAGMRLEGRGGGEYEVMYTVRGARHRIWTRCASGCQSSAIAWSSWVTRPSRRCTFTSARPGQRSRLRSRWVS